MSFENRKKYKIKELYESSSGLSKNRKEFGFGYPFLTFKDVFNNYFVPEKLNSFANTTEKERMRCSIEKGDIFITRTSETQDELGMSSVALKDYPGATFNGFTKRLRLKPSIKVDIYPKYIGYYLRSSKVRDQITSFSTLTTRASLNNSMLNMIEIELPLLEEQKAIGDILASLDDKIKLNNQINKNLEEMAQAIFKSWFVDFEPFQDGEFVESELGLIPIGWKVVNFNEIIGISSGKRPKSKLDIKNGEFIVPLIGASSVMGYVNEILFDEPLLVIGRVGTHGVVQRVYGKSWPSDNTLIIRSKYYEYAFQILKNIDYNSLNRGSTQPLITQTDIKNIKIIFPPTEIMEKLEENIACLYKMVYLNKKQNENLSDIRDTLLPKLMSGEIRVPLENQ